MFDLLGGDKTISFCYRQENELDDATVSKLVQHPMQYMIHTISQTLIASFLRKKQVKIIVYGVMDVPYNHG